ncbi:MAG: hypothetical protein D6731_08335 [Planctomycetota bacterium]|nr:MAG: hypothetical protein D6731_08335 [Planctomycetota bacterium]
MTAPPSALARALLGAVAASLVACGGEPEPAPPEAEPTLVGAEAAPSASEAPGTERRGPASVVIRARSFPKDVLALKAKDLVDVSLSGERGTVRGEVISVRPRELMLAIEGQGGAVTRFEPRDVEAVELLFRDDPREYTVGGDAPLNEDETWLDRFADREILGKDPRTLWKGRFARNVPLLVVRPFKLNALSFVKRRGRKVFFLPSRTPAVFRVHDQVKLVGISLGTQRAPGGKDLNLGEVYLYLVRRGQSVFSVYSRERLQGRNFHPKSVERFLEREPVTLAVTRPGASTYLKIVRVRASVARQYSRYLEKTPDRPAIRRLRARRSPELAKAEQQVRAVYKAVDLTREEDLDRPVVIEVRVPTVDAGIHLLPFRKELGLD